MHKIHFYMDADGHEPVLEYIRELEGRRDKDSRIKLNKIRDYMRILGERGTQAGEPYLKHLDGEIWELRPIWDRILFVAWYDDGYVLLHHFMKKTQKTPLREIEKAKRELADIRERWVNDEKE